MINNKAFERKLRFWLGVGVLYLRKHWLRSLLIIITILAIFFFGSKIAPNFQPQEVYSEGIIGNFSQDNLPSRVTTFLSEGLTKVAKDGSTQPALSENWQIKESGRIYLFSLEGNLLWQDNTKVKSSDMEIKMDNVEISYPDDKTLQFKLKDQYSPFLSVVSKPIFKKGTLVGTGQYRIGQIEKSGQTVKMVKLTAKDKKFPQLIFRFYPTFAQAVAAFKMGGIKAISNLSQTNSLSEWPNTKVIKEADYSHIVALFFNTKDPKFSAKEARQVLAYAIDKNGLKGEVAFSPIAPSSWAYNPEVRHYDQDLKKANSLLEKTQVKKEEKIVLSVLPAYQELGEKIIGDWKMLGLNLEMKIENTIPGDFQILLAGQEIPSDPDQYSLWHSTQTGNITKFQSAKIDKLLEDGRKIEDQKQRKEKYLEFQKVLSEEVPAVFLYYPHNYFIFSKKVEDKIEILEKLESNFTSL
jgi:peptide/nickel transport system substrate-binding protein